jgi:hypothetical protein
MVRSLGDAAKDSLKDSIECSQPVASLPNPPSRHCPGAGRRPRPKDDPAHELVMMSNTCLRRRLQAHSAGGEADGGRNTGFITKTTFRESSMLHYSCDLCKRPINSHTDARHVVKIEVFPAVEDAADGCCDPTNEGEDADHLEDMQELLESIDERSADHEAMFDDGTRSLRFDLCDACRLRFLKNPLGVKTGKKLDFSNN